MLTALPSNHLWPSALSPKPVTPLSHLHPCAHLQPTLQQRHLSNEFHFPPALQAEQPKSHQSWPSPVPPVSIQLSPCWTCLPLFLQSSGDGIGASGISKASVSQAGCCCPGARGSPDGSVGFAACVHPPAPSWLPVERLHGLTVVMGGERIADRWY